jgi:choline dehydrogenase-like flavoprotein
MPTFRAVTDKCIDGPTGDADNAIFEHCKKSIGFVWHFASTCRMGPDGDNTAVVDNEFRVRGVQALRVVDLSVVVVLLNGHTQSTLI